MFKFVTALPDRRTPPKGELGKARKDDLKRTIRNGLDGSMMPPFPQLTDAELDDLVGYVIHLSVRGETEFDTIAKAISCHGARTTRTSAAEFAEQLFAQKCCRCWATGSAADEVPIPVPPENTPTDGDRLASAVRGFKAFTGDVCRRATWTTAATPQLKCDLWGTVVQPRNLTLGVYRGGRRGEDLYARIYGGIYPATMPDSKAEGRRRGRTRQAGRDLGRRPLPAGARRPARAAMRCSSSTRTIKIE